MRALRGKLPDAGRARATRRGSPSGSQGPGGAARDRRISNGWRRGDGPDGVRGSEAARPTTSTTSGRWSEASLRGIAKLLTSAHRSWPRSSPRGHPDGPGHERLTRSDHRSGPECPASRPPPGSGLGELCGREGCAARRRHRWWPRRRLCEHEVSAGDPSRRDPVMGRRTSYEPGRSPGRSSPPRTPKPRNTSTANCSGGRVATEIPAGRFAAVRDPQGAAFSIFEGDVDD